MKAWRLIFCALKMWYFVPTSDSQNHLISDDAYNSKNTVLGGYFFPNNTFQEFFLHNNHKTFFPFEGRRWVLFSQENARVATMGTPSKSSTCRPVELAVTIWMVLKLAYLKQHFTYGNMVLVTVIWTNEGQD